MLLGNGAGIGLLHSGRQVPTGLVLKQQVRNVSRRRIAYPQYPFNRLTRQHPKRHDTNLKFAMRQFLGPKNYKGEYVLNKYSKVPTNNVPNYINPDQDRGKSLVDPISNEPLTSMTYFDDNGKERTKYERVSTFNTGRRAYNNTGNNNKSDESNNRNISRRQLQPFPQNEYCKTNYWIDDALKSQIFNDIENNGLSTQQVSQKYGLKVPRIEAIVKLYPIERRWEDKKFITDDLKKMANTMEGMFPLFKPDVNYMRENLSEIPIPTSALQSRFVTLAESEPFGPLDAAKVLELEPAVKILDRLATYGEHSTSNTNDHPKKTRIIYSELKKGDRSVFKFVDAKAKDVAFRYGSGNRDNKKDRRIGFDEKGQMVYI